MAQDPTDLKMAMQAPHAPFDRQLVVNRRARLLAGDGGAEFLFEDAAARLADRLEDVTRSFPVAVELGARLGAFSRLLGSHPRVARTVLMEPNPALAHRLHGQNLPGATVVCADEQALPLADQGVDLVTSSLALHWVNDLPGTFAQIRRALKPDGLFLACLFGGNSLTELREVLAAAETEVTGGLSARVSPFVDVRDAGNLLGRAGFALPVADVDTVTISYTSLFALMDDLRAMGESNALALRHRAPTRREMFLRAAELYAARHARADGRITVTVDLVFLTAWAPSATQAKPMKPGSGEISLADILNADPPNEETPS